MNFKKSKNTVPYDDKYDDIIQVNLYKVRFIRLYNKDTIYFYFGNGQQVAWKYVNKQKAMEALEEIYKLTSLNVDIDEAE